MRRRGGRDCQFSEAASCRGVHWVARAEASKQLDALGSREQRCTSRACISRRTAPHHVATDQPRHAFAVSPPFAVASFRALICLFVFGMSAIMSTAVPSKTPVPTNTNVLTRTTTTTTMRREIVRRSLHDRSKHCPCGMALHQTRVLPKQQHCNAVAGTVRKHKGPLPESRPLGLQVIYSVQIRLAEHPELWPHCQVEVWIRKKKFNHTLCLHDLARNRTAPCANALRISITDARSTAFDCRHRDRCRNARRGHRSRRCANTRALRRRGSRIPPCAK